MVVAAAASAAATPGLAPSSGAAGSAEATSTALERLLGKVKLVGAAAAAAAGTSSVAAQGGGGGGSNLSSAPEAAGGGGVPQQQQQEGAAARASSHPIEESVVTSFFYYLWKKKDALQAESGISERDVRIPHTVCYEHGYAKGWYSGGSRRGFARRQGRDIDSAAVHDAMCGIQRKGTKPSPYRRRPVRHVCQEDIVATYLEQLRGPDGVSFTLRHLDSEDLRAFLTLSSPGDGGGGSGAHSQRKRNGVLQQFIPPGERDHAIHVLWSPHLCRVEKRLNKHALFPKAYGSSNGGGGNGGVAASGGASDTGDGRTQPPRPHSERTVGFEGTSAHDGEAYVAPRVRETINRVCGEIAEHFRTLEHRSIERMSLFFKTGMGSELWLLWCSSVSLAPVVCADGPLASSLVRRRRAASPSGAAAAAKALVPLFEEGSSGGGGGGGGGGGKDASSSPSASGRGKASAKPVTVLDLVPLSSTSTSSALILSDLLSPANVRRQQRAAAASSTAWRMPDRLVFPADPSMGSAHDSYCPTSKVFCFKTDTLPHRSRLHQGRLKACRLGVRQQVGCVFADAGVTTPSQRRGGGGGGASDASPLPSALQKRRSQSRLSAAVAAATATTTTTTSSSAAAAAATVAVADPQTADGAASAAARTSPAAGAFAGSFYKAASPLQPPPSPATATAAPAAGLELPLLGELDVLGGGDPAAAAPLLRGLPAEVAGPAVRRAAELQASLAQTNEWLQLFLYRVAYAFAGRARHVFGVPCGAGRTAHHKHLHEFAESLLAEQANVSVCSRPEHIERFLAEQGGESAAALGIGDMFEDGAPATRSKILSIDRPRLPTLKVHVDAFRRRIRCDANRELGVGVVSALAGVRAALAAASVVAAAAGAAAGGGATVGGGENEPLPVE